MNKIVLATWATWMVVSSLTMGAGLALDRDRVINFGFGGLVSGIAVLFLGLIGSMWAWAL